MSNTIPPKSAAKPPRKKYYIPTGRPRGRPKGSRTAPKQAEVMAVKQQMISVKSAARALDVSESYVRKLYSMKPPRLVKKKFGTAVRITMESFEALVRGDA
jgi:hypothetical protein